MPLNRETLNFRTANIQDDARLDIKANSFWRYGQTAFFDIRVTHVNSDTNRGQETAKIFKTHEGEKKRQYLQRVIEIEKGTFTPLVFGTNGGMGKESIEFIKNLANMLAKHMNVYKYNTGFAVLRNMSLWRAMGDPACAPNYGFA